MRTLQRIPWLHFIKQNCISTSLTGNCLLTYPAGLLQKNKTHRSLPPPDCNESAPSEGFQCRDRHKRGTPALLPGRERRGGKETELGVVVPSFSAQDLVISPTTTTRTVVCLPGREARILQCLELGLIHIHFDQCLYFASRL